MTFIYMSKRLLLWLSGAVCAAGIVLAAQAQTPSGTVSVPAGQTASGVTAPSARTDAQLADYIVAIVQHEPITNSQVRAHVLSIQQQYKGREMPPVEQLRQMALQQLISQSALAQRAHERGMQADQQMVQMAISTIAQNNNMSVAQLKTYLEGNGIPFSTLTRDIEQQLVIRQLRERTLDPTITVSNAEVDEFLEQRGNTDPEMQQINLAQILIAVPENASQAEIDRLQAKAQEVYQKASAPGADFLTLAEQFSDEPNVSVSRGVMGARPISLYPDLFIKTVEGLQEGAVAPPVRSGAGFHVLKVLQRERSDMVVTQTHVRHILLNVTEAQTEQEAIDKLAADKRMIESKQATFEELAQEQSQDASAKAGGDLGWVVPGMFVPEFEQVMNQLAPGQISDPVVSRFGVHLIQVLERRDAQLTPQQQREVARETIRQSKVQVAYDQWAHDIESSAYIEMRDPPR